ncbi:MAG: trigger factor [Verrucomicrobia bacterium]|nr:trigger factor [Verrucomicrobiota bacterium]
MNVTVETIAPCKKQLRVEIDAQSVDSTFESITAEFRKEARFPGFRPGKAPKDMVVRKFDKDIQDEVKRKLISDHYRKALEDHKLDVVGPPDIEELQFGRGQPLHFLATVETAPEFQLPEYKGLPVTLESRQVTDQDVEKAVDLLRSQRVEFKTVERAATAADMVVVNYTATCDGQPLTDIAPTAKGLTEQSNFWVDMEPGKFIPGFSEQLVGTQAGDQRAVHLTFPPDFVTPQLAGRQAVYAVGVVEVKERVLPALSDEFAHSFGAEDLTKLKEGVRRDLENELKYSRNKAIRTQLIRSLLDRVQFDLPESTVAQETRNVVYDIVSENTKRGVSRDIIEKQKGEIYTAAAQGARERVKVSFLLRKIAEKENIGVSQEEVARRIQVMATMYQIPPEQFVKDLQKRNGVVEIYDQLASEKTLDFLQAQAKIEETPAAASA